MSRLGSTWTLIGLVLASLVIFAIPRTPNTGPSSLVQCSQATHDSYQVAGPDGLAYARWHPIVDDYHHCYFDHEHGSNPALFGPITYLQVGTIPAFGYTSTKMGMTEGHVGFKNLVVSANDGYVWMITIHFGTGNPLLAACTRYHTYDLVGKEISTQQIVADLHMMLDYGVAVSNETGQRLQPVGCPNQGTEPPTSNGVRQFAVNDGSPVAYEPWRPNRGVLPAIGFDSGGDYINTYNPEYGLDSITATTTFRLYEPDRSPMLGTLRYYAPTYGFRITGVVSGTFYTDPHGLQSRVGTEPDAVKQYIRPGFSYQFPVTGKKYWPQGAYDMPYQPATNADAPTDIFIRRIAFITGSN